jgi:hypothetical protein
LLAWSGIAGRRFQEKFRRANQIPGKNGNDDLLPVFGLRFYEQAAGRTPAWNKNLSGNLCQLPRYAVEEIPMKRFIKAGLIAVALAVSATVAFAMPRVPASAITTDGDAVVLVKGGHGHGHGHMGRGGRGHHYGWGRGRGHHYGHHRRYH